jgi:hypothetical protein
MGEHRGISSSKWAIHSSFSASDLTEKAAPICGQIGLLPMEIKQINGRSTLKCIASDPTIFFFFWPFRSSGISQPLTDWPWINHWLFSVVWTLYSIKLIPAMMKGL